MIIKDKKFDEERALYAISDSQVEGCDFDGPADGESALKECRNISVIDCRFNLRYPFWHTTDADISGCELTPLCRAALWYDDDVRISDTKLNGIKALRECSRITIDCCTADSPEILWRCNDITIRDTTIVSQYPFFECRDMHINNLNLTGKYSFQYVENVEIYDSVLNTKDAFWHSRNVTVYDSVVNGEYLGWYSSGLRLVRCHITGTQPLCYCSDLVLQDCTMDGTDLCFERSSVTADIIGSIDSVKNPSAGTITADSIGDIILEPDYIDPTATQISVRTAE